MPRRIRYWLAVGLMTAALAWAVWSGTPANPATLISRVDVFATALILAAVPWPVARRFGPVRDGWLPRIARFAGYLGVVGLVLAKANAERVEYARSAGRPGLTGLWVGEVLFLLVLSGYVTGLLIATARRSPASPAASTTGVLGGVVLGLTIYVVRPLEGPLHTSSAWLTAVYFVGRLISIPLVLCAAIAVGIAAVRRSANRGSSHAVGQTPAGLGAAGPQPVTAESAAQPSAGSPSRARQGVVAGLCAGAAAALLVSLLGISTIALAPHDARVIQWTLPRHDARAGSVYEFEVSVSEAAAGYLLVLVLFPLCGAGLGAWGGLYGADRPGRPGGDDGGGRGGPDPDPTPPPGGLQLDNELGPAVVDIRRILDSPEWTGVATGPAPPGRDTPIRTPAPDPAVPDRRERIPASSAPSPLAETAELNPDEASVLASV
ncbi:MAG: hypothetical protein ACLQFR_25685 [Streptosporangiaceae bacterium]